MAYAVPPRWSHGNTVSVANMQKYSDALNAIYTQTGASSWNPGVVQITTNFTAFLFHRLDWLYYLSTSGRTATIVDLSGTESSVTLPDATSSVASYDLRSISWLTKGTLYKITGLSFAIEDVA